MVQDDPDPIVENSDPEAPSPGRVIPPDDPADHDKSKAFRTGDAALRVTARGGEVTRRYAPAEFVARLIEHVAKLLRDVGGGFPPMLFAAQPGQSMTLLFGDPLPEGIQTQLPVEAVLANAIRVSKLLSSEEDSLLVEAIRLGEPAQRYVELTSFLASTGVTLDWVPRGQKAVRLTPSVASRQHDYLSMKPPTTETSVSVNGRLYRVIAEPTEAGLGTVGIHLFEWSARPPTRTKGSKIILRYEDPDVAEAIKKGLIGESIRATLTVRQAQPGASFSPGKHLDEVLTHIERGPDAGSGFGIELWEQDASDDD